MLAAKEKEAANREKAQLPAAAKDSEVSPDWPSPYT